MSAGADGPESGDPVLRPFLTEREDAESRRLLGELIAREAEPLVAVVVGRRLGASPERDDVRGQVRLRLVRALVELRSAGGAPPIQDFRGYVATVAAHACDDALRVRYPQRQRLRNRIRYLLARDPCCVVRRDGAGRWLCSLDGSKARPLPAASWFSDPRAFLRAALAEAPGPIELDELVGRTAAAAGVSSEPAQAPFDDRFAAPESSIPERLDRRRALERLWLEILALPARQRTALLLGLRDARTPDVIAVFPLAGVASVRQIAAALEIPAEELAALWNELPLDDLKIAARLGLSRQQVINLRAAARARLARRMRTRPGNEYREVVARG